MTMHPTAGTICPSYDLDSVVKLLNASTKVQDMKERKNPVSDEDTNIVVSKYTENEESADKKTNNDEDSNKNKVKEVLIHRGNKYGRRGGKSLIPSQTYVDHIDTIFDEKKITSVEVLNLQLYNQSKMGTSPFPVKLQILLKTAEELGFQHIISWLPHGRSFTIHRPLLFEKQIMGEFLSQTKFSSFKRQLNLYDFKRITNGVDSGSYYHEMFLRGKPVLAMKMARRKIKGQIRVSTYVHKEPEFYSMPFMGSIFDDPPCHHSNIEHRFDQGTFMIPTRIRRKEIVRPPPEVQEDGQQERSSVYRNEEVVMVERVYNKYLDTTRRRFGHATSSFPGIQSGTAIMTSAPCYYMNDDLFLSTKEELYRRSRLPFLAPQEYVVQNNPVTTTLPIHQQQFYQNGIDYCRHLFPVKCQEQDRLSKSFMPKMFYRS